MIVLATIYILCLLGLAIYGLNSLWMTILYLRSRDRNIEEPSRKDFVPLPSVTVQLPVYNERYMAKRLLEAAIHLDYPNDRLQIQVLDDSDDYTVVLVRDLVAHYQAMGINIQLIRRANRNGFKAGALAEGLKTATGDLVAIFDADFVPHPDWLMRTVPQFQNGNLGCLQTRWGHLNRDYNALTRAQALGIDGHFVIEQNARSRNGLFLNFNGTAGIWRRAAIEDAGGWQSDTLTEDLDLSYRAQLRGWKIGYLSDVVVAAELPVQVDALKSQQFRWAKGTMQTVRKLMPRLFKTEMPWRVRLGAIVHLTGYLVHPLMVLTLILTLPVGYYDGVLTRYFSWAGLIGFGPPLLYTMAKTQETPRLSDRLRLLPLLFFLGFGLSLNNAMAVAQGLFTRGGSFKRTPKFNLRDREGDWLDGVYSIHATSIAWGELALAGYAFLTIVLLWPIQGWAPIPWLLSYVCGYTFVAGTSAVQNYQVRRVQPNVAGNAGRSAVSM
jgi:cellulose synthase/poly-beta-1,6-N-acetylglucosamine synthase-like glycosyltransferase